MMLNPKFQYISNLSLFGVLILEACSIELVCEDRYGITQHFDYSTTYGRAAVKNKCSAGRNVWLVNETTLHLSGEEVTYEPFRWLFMIRNLGLCLIIDNSKLIYAYVGIKSLNGTCKGPKLSIVNNPHLERLTLSDDVVPAMKSVPDALRIRGNRKLYIEDINIIKKHADQQKVLIDLQTFGECALPKPFLSFETLDRNCSKFYGNLVLKEDTTNIYYDSTKVHIFEIEACIQIEKTELKDITFLIAFSRFKPIPFCPQYIRDNKYLCSTNLNYFNSYFKNVAIFNNLNQSCSDCMGWQVSEQYLGESANCSFIYGDLVIAHLRGLPRYIDNLRTIETIQGRLIIFNNTGLGNFTFFSSLKRVGLKNESNVAVVVKDNPDLKTLPMPKLLDFALKKGDKRAEIVNNPMLKNIEKKHQEEKELVQAETMPFLVEFFTKYFAQLLYLMCVAFVAISLSILGAFVMFWKKKSSLKFPELPCDLSTRSKQQLAYFCTEILSKTPMLWCVEDLNLLWNRRRTPTPNSVCGSLAHVDFTKNCMIPVTRNGRISQRKQLLQRKSLQSRVEEILDYDIVVIVGTLLNVSDVVPGLPDIMGHFSAYEGGAEYKLIEVKQISSMSTKFIYEVKNDDKVIKNIQIVLYCWLPEQIPMEFSEVLRLVAFVKGRKAVCTSNRRKEAFSVLHLFYTCVVRAKGPQSATEVFKLHSSLCNGAPLDRREMLYIMRILLEWAKSANCVSTKIEKKLSQWCQIYDQMASFTKKHANIVNVHPLQLTRLDCIEALNSEVFAAKNQSMSLSERPFAMSVDRFRRKTPEEIKQEMVKTSKTITEDEGVNAFVESATQDNNTLMFFCKETG